MIDGITITLMLSAALLHASWHALVKGNEDQVAALAGMGLVAGAIAACILPFVALPVTQAWLVIGVSLVFHVSYKLGLARSYVYGDLSQAYPLVRGLVPTFATVIAFVALDQRPAWPQLAGILVVSAGLIWLALHAIRDGANRRIFLVAAIAGLSVAAYSAIDAYGVRIANDWLAYTAWLVFLDGGLFFLLVLLLNRRATIHQIVTLRVRTLASGFLGMGSFLVFLWALSRAPVGPVTALREASVLFATLIGLFVYKEPRSWPRLGAALTIGAGLMIIAAFR